VLIYFNFLYAHMSLFHWEEGRLTVFGNIVTEKYTDIRRRKHKTARKNAKWKNQ
jgi:uncharacterized membrane protein